MTNAHARVLIGDAHSLSRVGISDIFQRLVGLKAVAHAHDFDALTTMLTELEHWAIVVIDTDLPGMPGLASVRNLRQNFPASRITLISNDTDRTTMIEAIAAGAHGYIPKCLSESEMAEAFRTILAGRVYVPDQVAAIPTKTDSDLATANSSPVEDLTQRQRDVLTHLRRGNSNKHIARLLGISEHTVKVHLAAAFRRLGVHNRVGAISVLLDWERTPANDQIPNTANTKAQMRVAG
jgi:DNA-binding NarL/FixJ family response regulator